MLIRDPVLRPDIDHLLKNLFKSYRASNKSPKKCNYTTNLIAHKQSIIRDQNKRSFRTPESFKESICDPNRYSGDTLNNMRHGKGLLGYLFNRNL